MSRNGKKIIRGKTRQDDGTPAYEAVLIGSGAVVSVLSPTAGSDFTPVDPADENQSTEYQWWGSDNLFPTNARKKVEASTTAFPLIAKMAGLMFGTGLTYYRETVDKDGKLTRDYTRIPEVDKFLEENDIQYFMLERLVDYKMFNNLFCEFILDKAMNKIVNIGHLEAEFSRFGEIDTKTKLIKNILYDGDWAKPQDKTSIPFLDRRKANKDNIKKIAASSKKFAMHICFPSPGCTLYAHPPHYAIFKDKGWLDYINSIPVIMNSINDNAWDIRWHIRIPYSYWPSINKDWNSLDKETQNKIIDEKLQAMDEWLTGKKNAGKRFVSHFATDQMTGKPLAGWEIIPLDSKSKKDDFITSVQEGDIQVTRALGVDPALAGIQPTGGKMGAGSGSDKRTAFTNAVSMSRADLMIVTYPMTIIQRYNGWPADIRWTFEHELPTTLNEDKSGVVSTTND